MRESLNNPWGISKWIGVISYKFKGIISYTWVIFFFRITDKTSFNS